jgi:transposase-like protein
MDETYIKVSGEWMDLYRAVDIAGKTVDFHLNKKRENKLHPSLLHTVPDS